MKPIFIYTLSHPTSLEIRYVGKSNDPNRRYCAHISNKKKTSHCASWIKSLKAEHLLPKLTIIEECNENSWPEREKFWITQFNNLTNHTPGGLGGGNKHSDETKKKMSLTRKGRQSPTKGLKLSDETRKKMSKAKKGIKTGSYGYKHSDETKKKMSKSRKGIKRGPYGPNLEMSKTRKGIKRGPYKKRTIH